jgi:hypothetical protein
MRGTASISVFADRAVLHKFDFLPKQDARDGLGSCECVGRTTAARAGQTCQCYIQRNTCICSDGIFINREALRALI